MTLQILISTIGAAGIERVAAMLPPLPVERVSYLVSWQMPEGPVPAALERDDVEICRLQGRGLSRNRNNALAHATGDVLLIADDDLLYDTASLSRVISFFEHHPDIDAALFKIIRPGNCVYPADIVELRRGHYPKGYFVSSIEIALRRATTVHCRFDERFGLGSRRFGSGEEELFVDSLLREGKRVVFNPLVIGKHPPESTSLTGLRDRSVQQASGAVISRLYGWSTFPRLLLKAIRMSRAGAGALFSVAYNVILGAVQARFMKW